MSVLFMSDWGRFPNAIADFETTNESFLKVVALYRKMGIKNAYFPLLLLQKELQGIDPYSEDLDDDIKLKILMECVYNPWYFLREVVRIPAVAGPIPIKYIANRGNMALTWAFLNSVDIALIQPRQTGKSVSTDCAMVWLIYFGTTNSLVNMFTKDNELRVKNVERLKKIRDLLPDYLIVKSKQDTDNQINLTYKNKENYYQTSVAQNSESAAGNLGRGLTSPVMHIDEGPFIKFIGTTIPAALAGGIAAKEEAERNGRLHGNIFTTTAGKKDDRDGRYMYNMIHGGMPWSEQLFDARDKEELIKMVRRNCTGRKTIINATFSHRQLGRTDEWLYRKIAEVNAEGEEADRDFFNVWTSGSQSSPLPVEVNEKIKNSEMDPVYTEITNDCYIVRWYKTEEEIKELMKETRIIAGMDTSDAIGRDAIAISLMDVRDLSVVGAATINETNLIRFAKFLSDLMIKYESIILIPERKSSAQSIIDYLLISLPKAGVDPFKRIFNHIVNGYLDKEKEYNEICTSSLSSRTHSFYEKYKKQFGFNTTGESRNLLYSSVLQTVAKDAGHLVRDRILSEEVRGLVVKNGRIDHTTGGHDDMVISWLMPVWFLTHTKNLEFYGIDTKRALSKVNHLGRELSLEEEYELDKQKKIHLEIESIYEELISCSDEYLITKYEARLRYLDTQVKETTDNSMSIDSLIKNAHEIRNRERRKRSLQSRHRQNMQYRQYR